MIVEDGRPLALVGTPRERGAAQAAPCQELADAVRAVTQARDAELARLRRSNEARAYLDDQFAFARSHCEPELAETEGVAEGFRLDPRAVFDALHAAALSRFASAEGCTAWAAGGNAPLLAKNRDIRADLLPLQQVMRHEDRAHPMRVVLCVGSLGAPGAYSSGMNRAGLAVADTAISAPEHGTGWLRYFLMTRLLWECADVGEALDFARSAAHTGGGSLVLADRHGAVAAVEFPGAKAAIERSARVSRTNHFVTTGAPDGPGHDEADRANSTARLAFLRAALDAHGAPYSAEGAAALMASHADNAALCRHAEDAATRTVSSAVFLPSARELLFAPDYPCLGRWHRHSLAAYDR